MTNMGLSLAYAFNYHFDKGVFHSTAFANITLGGGAAGVLWFLNRYELQGQELRVEYKKILRRLPSAARQSLRSSGGATWMSSSTAPTPQQLLQQAEHLPIRRPAFSPNTSAGLSEPFGISPYNLGGQERQSQGPLQARSPHQR